MSSDKRLDQIFDTPTYGGSSSYYRVASHWPAHVAIHSRNHSPDIILGLRRTARNGLQLFCGNVGVTVSWVGFPRKASVHVGLGKETQLDGR